MFILSVSIEHHSIPQPDSICLSSLASYAPVTSATSSYLHHSLTAGLQEKMAAEGFEPAAQQPLSDGLSNSCLDAVLWGDFCLVR